ncbi:hypothetical protein M885DRAFT_192840 [Pelagophyceae sp. CCMP2097]|nr:hypothetical protein M885DRAFT_192840 [Pelagophyceae sp. CCMP2097]
MQAAPGMSAEGMAAIIAAAVQTAMAGLAAVQTGPAEPTTPPRRPRAEQQSRTPKSDASFLNYKTLVDKEYRVTNGPGGRQGIVQRPTGGVQGHPPDPEEVLHQGQPHRGPAVAPVPQHQGRGVQRLHDQARRRRV